MLENVNNFLTEIIDEDIKNGLSERIHTRFPPEPNGYLHIGSAKAIFINWSNHRHTQQSFQQLQEPAYRHTGQRDHLDRHLGLRILLRARQPQSGGKPGHPFRRSSAHRRREHRSRFPCHSEIHRLLRFPEMHVHNLRVNS